MVLNWQVVLAVCAGFVCVVTALEKLQEIIKKTKEPSKDVQGKLQRDYDRINDLDKQMKDIVKVLKYLIDSQNLLISNDRVILEHLRTNNSTGDITKREDAIDKFLEEHQLYNDAFDEKKEA